MIIALKRLPPKKKYYQESDFPLNTFNGSECHVTARPIKNGKNKNRSYRVCTIEAPDGGAKKFGKGLAAFSLTVLSLGFGLFSPRLRKLWRETMDGKTRRKVKVLVGESTNKTSFITKRMRPVNKAADIIQPSEKKLFATLDRLLKSTKRDKAHISPILNKIAKIPTNNLSDEQRKMYINQINAIRKPFLTAFKQKQARRLDNTAIDRYILNELNALAFKFIKKKYFNKLEKHFVTMVNDNTFQQYDGKITPEDHATNATRTIAIEDANQEDWSNLPGFNADTHQLNFNVRQLKALSQVEGRNNLCPYYALFSLVQDLNGKDLCDRSAFMQFCDNLAWKKIRQYFLSLADGIEDIKETYSFDEDATSLDPINLSALASELPELKQRNNWYVMDDYFTCGEMERAVGMTIKMNIFPQSRNDAHKELPLYFIYQAIDHYYYVKAQRNQQGMLDITIAHSINYNVLSDPDFGWGDHQWRGLINYISHFVPRAEQTHTPSPPPRP